MKKALISGLWILGSLATAAVGQATTTASRQFDLQAGGGFVYDRSDYYTKPFHGYGIYSTLDFTPHFGAEVDFRQADSQVDKGYERTYEFGGRYHRNYRRFSPYVKALYGRGVFNYVYNGTVVANLAYNEYALGGGVDYRLLSYLNVRADYEHQSWLNFPPNGLTPQLVTVGVAYHFPGGLKRGQRFK